MDRPWHAYLDADRSFSEVGFFAPRGSYTHFRFDVYLWSWAVIFQRPSNQWIVSVVLSLALPGWAVVRRLVVALAPRCRRGKAVSCGDSLASSALRTVWTAVTAFVDYCRPPIVLHVPSANAVPSRPLISSSSSTGWIDPRLTIRSNTMWQTLLVVRRWPFVLRPR